MQKGYANAQQNPADTGRFAENPGLRFVIGADVFAFQSQLSSIILKLKGVPTADH